MKKLNIALIFLVFSSCIKDDYVDYSAHLNPDSIEYFMFGIAFAECFFHEDCTMIFKLEGNSLFEDVYEGGQVIPFDSISFNATYVNLASTLIDAIPKELIESDQDIYGCPNCGDQGEFYLRLKTDTIDRKWRIDTYDDEQSKAIIDFKRKVEEILNTLPDRP